MSRPGGPALLTDLYQLTMAHAYLELGMADTAVFELFVRRLPPGRRFLIAAGLEQVLEYLEGLQFSAEEIAFLRTLGLFPETFLEQLLRLRFSGSVHAMPEGTPFFADEPILRVTAPIVEAQLVESRLLNIAHFQTLIASKAARCVLAARGCSLVDFGMRRAHEGDAAVHAARAAYLAGFDATATVEAGRRFDIPLSGTMAHSFIEAHDGEEESFRRFVQVRKRGAVLLIDTYDTGRAAQRVATLACEGAAAGSVRGVRIDSGDLAVQARAVRRILDGAGCGQLGITLSGNLDEFRIEALVASGTPVNAFGVGTSLDVSADVPALDAVYKLQDYASRPRRKRSPGKETWPGRKQVYRSRTDDGTLRGDDLVLDGESCAGEPLLVEVMRDGRRVATLPTLAEARAHCQRQLAALPPRVKELEQGEGGYPVRVSAALRSLAEAIDDSTR